jgi:hypothetical protein
LEEVAVHEGLMKIYDNSAFIVGDPCGILGQQLRLCPIYALNINK